MGSTLGALLTRPERWRRHAGIGDFFEPRLAEIDELGGNHAARIAPGLGKMQMPPGGGLSVTGIVNRVALARAMPLGLVAEIDHATPAAIDKMRSRRSCAASKLHTGRSLPPGGARNEAALTR